MIKRGMDPAWRPRPSGGLGEATGGRGSLPILRACRAALLLALTALLSGIPVRAPAQGVVLRPVERPSLLDDGDLDSLRAAVAQSLNWLDRQPPGRVLIFGPRRLTTADYAAGL